MMGKASDNIGHTILIFEQLVSYDFQRIVVEIYSNIKFTIYSKNDFE